MEKMGKDVVRIITKMNVVDNCNHPDYNVQASSRVAASQQTLQIFNLQRDDYGVYQCFVARLKKKKIRKK